MKTNKMKTSMFMVLGAILFNSCAKDNTNLPNNEGVAVKFSSTLGSNLKTASAAGDTATYWLNTDQIGIYMVNNGTSNIVTGADNVLYTATPQTDARTADFSPQGNPIYYPVDSTQHVNFIAYYPYSASQTGNYSYPIDLTDQTASTSQTDNDLLYANNGVSYNKQWGNINLVFHHVLSKLVLKITAGDGLTADSLQNMVVTIDSLQTVGTFDLSTNSISLNTAGRVTALTTLDGSSAQAILLPQSATFSINFTLVNGDTYTWTPSATTLNAETQYTYNVKISRTAISVIGTVTDWTMQSDPSTHTVN